jgi:predicted HicB family RNase H-like nuclease
MMSAMTTQVSARLPDELAKSIKERADKVGLSQNAWLVKALEWAVEQPVRITKREERV